jgi:hypothetical protein
LFSNILDVIFAGVFLKKPERSLVHVNHQIGQRNQVIPSAQCFFKQSIFAAESCISRKKGGLWLYVVPVLIDEADTQPKVNQPYLV